MKVSYVSAIIFFLFIACISCKPETKSDQPETPKVESPLPDTVKTTPKEIGPVSNERFQDVRVRKLSDHEYEVSGKAQVFEAAFSWVVEDGHDELKAGHEMTDAGAPAWGNFKFSVDVTKKIENSTLILILYESSPKDGSRQYELPVPLVF